MQNHCNAKEMRSATSVHVTDRAHLQEHFEMIDSARLAKLYSNANTQIQCPRTTVLGGFALRESTAHATSAAVVVINAIACHNKQGSDVWVHSR